MEAIAALLLLTMSAPSAAAAPEARPAPPQRPALRLTEADCAIAERRDPVIADPDSFIAESASYGQALNLHSERLMEWRNRQLRATGHWTDEDETRFGLALIEDPEFAEQVAISLNLAMDTLTPFTRFGEEGRSAQDKCRDLVEAGQLFDRISRSVERQWELIDEAFAAEAARLGISLD